MSSLGLVGPFAFDSQTIDKKVTEKSAGNYALGRLNPKTGKFVPKYVGRSDTDLNAELKQRLNTHGHHSHFCADYANSPKDAYSKECGNFHDFEHQLENEIHPDSPDGMNLECPRIDEHDD